MESQINIKTCPFCGNEAYLDKASADLSDECSKNYIIRCKGCRVSTAWFEDKDRCIKAWNKRVQASGICFSTV